MTTANKDVGEISSLVPDEIADTAWQLYAERGFGCERQMS